MRYYCQFSYGGFKTYRIKGDTNESLEEVTSENRLDFPELCEYYFNHGGAKMLYRYIDENTLALIVREIPGPTTSPTGSPISTAVQFVGNKDEKEALDKLCLYICQNLTDFQRQFSGMFSTRGGLHFDGDKLKLISESPSVLQAPTEILNAIQNNSATILLLVTDSPTGTDEKITHLFDSLKLEGRVYCLQSKALSGERVTGKYIERPVKHLPQTTDLGDNEDDSKKKSIRFVFLVLVAIILLALLIISSISYRMHQTKKSPTSSQQSKNIEMIYFIK